MIVIGCPIKDRGWAIPWWWRGIEAQGLRLGDDFEVVALLSPSNDDTEQQLFDRGVKIIYDDEPGRAVDQIDGHFWSEPQYEYMARIRNRLLEHVIDLKPDYFFSLDSDIVLPEGAIDRLLHILGRAEGVIAPAVNMTQYGTAWNTMSFSNEGGLVHRPTNNPAPGRADVIMAAMLMDEQGMECRWASHMAGEDIGFCIDAQQKHVPRWWSRDVRGTHLMHPQSYRNE